MFKAGRALGYLNSRALKGPCFKAEAAGLSAAAEKSTIVPIVSIVVPFWGYLIGS